LPGVRIGVAALPSPGDRQLFGRTSILAGVAVFALSGALMSLALTLAPNPFALAEISVRLLGGRDGLALCHVVLLALPMLLGCVLLRRLGPGLDAHTLEEDAAASLGRLPATLCRAAIGCAGARAAVGGGVDFAGSAAGCAGAAPRLAAWLRQIAHVARPLSAEQIVTFGRIPHGDAALAPIDNALRQWR
jgi:iron complex transport system permease protein